MARHIKTGIRSLKTPGPGAVAHMSLHQKPTMSKSHQHHRRTVMAPRFVTGGPTVRSVLATEANRASRNRQGRVGEGPYMEALDSGQPPFCNFISRLRETPGNPWFYVGYRPRIARAEPTRRGPPPRRPADDFRARALSGWLRAGFAPPGSRACADAASRRGRWSEWSSDAATAPRPDPPGRSLPRHRA